MTRKPDGGPESIGAVLARLRTARGLSQLRLAERLCAAAGTPTVSRHEISRWEREERIPGRFWLGWLAEVLEVPLPQLAAAVEAARGQSAAAGPAAVGEQLRLWRAPAAAELTRMLDLGPDHDLRELAHAWLTGPPDQDLAPAAPAGAAAPAEDPDAGARPGDRLALHRRMDDQVGGLDLAAHLGRELRTVISETPPPGPDRRARLRAVAGWAQLSGWALADADEPVAARRAYRVALRASAAAGDRTFAAHVLGSLSHLSLAVGDPLEALLLARTGHLGGHHCAPPPVRALLLHRVALAAAHCGERRAADHALVAAERAYDHTSDALDWLYWLDPAECAAMTGRCLLALDRPRAAVPLLANPRRPGPRAAALYAGRLATAYARLGEVEQACRTATAALPDAIRAGSARAGAELRRFGLALSGHRDLPVVRSYHQLLRTTAPYLSGPPTEFSGAPLRSKAR